MAVEESIPIRSCPTCGKQVEAYHVELDVPASLGERVKGSAQVGNWFLMPHPDCDFGVTEDVAKERLRTSVIPFRVGGAVN